MLRVLDLQDVPIDELPDEVEHTNRGLPRGIGNLQNLRHLIMYQYVNGTNVPSNISRLTNLQSVSAIESNGDLIQQIRSMTQLTRIGISNVKEVDEMDLCLSIQNMKLLRYLFIMATKAEELFEWIHSQLLLQASIAYFGWKTRKSAMVVSFTSKRHIFVSALVEAGRRCTPFYIATLPHLGDLSLRNAYVGKQLCFITGFPKLTKLYIQISLN
ncbi:disease resistance protein rpm1 [Quercus suber]|uniref:Disease resistance protein rpm1 n=1 Tax=Quercus suber TaxID=58331 RepID=A0AAW0KI99_QUESU